MARNTSEIDLIRRGAERARERGRIRGAKIKAKKQLKLVSTMVPKEVAEKLVALAIRDGMSLSAYLRALLVKQARKG